MVVSPSRWAGWAGTHMHRVWLECDFWSEYVSTCGNVPRIGSLGWSGYLWGHTAVTITLSPLSRLSPIDRGGMRPGIHTSHPPRTAPRTGHGASPTSNMYWGTRSYHFICKKRLWIGPSLASNNISFLSTMRVLGRHNRQCHYPPHYRGWWWGGSLLWTGPGWCETAACKSRRPAPPRTHRSHPAHCSLHQHSVTWGLHTSPVICSFSAVLRYSCEDFTITEKAPTRAFSWLKVPTSPFAFKTLLRHCGKQVIRDRRIG